jgi:hypothetical protein
MKYPTEDHKLLLKNKPWYHSIHEELNKILQEIEPGSHIVAPFRQHIDPTKIAHEGKLDTGKVLLLQMEESKCHDNVDELFEYKIIQKVSCGYALSDDGLWRFHSWGNLENGEIIETCSVREKYFGIHTCVVESN